MPEVKTEPVIIVPAPDASALARLTDSEGRRGRGETIPARVLPPEARDGLRELLENPPPPTAALRELLATDR